jgi:hypothetical protein
MIPQNHFSNNPYVGLAAFIVGALVNEDLISLPRDEQGDIEPTRMVMAIRLVAACIEKMPINQDDVSPLPFDY